MAPPDNRKVFSSMGLVTGLGISAGGSLLLGVLLGLVIDRMLGATPLFLVIGMLLGLAGAIVSVYRLVLREMRD
jgi:F0F1-type ATP synthase assembly protein I